VVIALGNGSAVLELGLIGVMGSEKATRTGITIIASAKNKLIIFRAYILMIVNFLAYSPGACQINRAVVKANIPLD
jgi:hypothetical protein